MFSDNEPTSDVLPPRYSTVAIILHWLIAALLIFQVALGLRMEDAHGRDKFAVFQLHKSVGISLLLLIVVRLLWRLTHRPPPIGAAGWEKTLAKVVHGAFYLILLALPISGWVIVSSSKILVPTLLYGVVPWPHVPGVAGLSIVAKQSWNAAADFIHVNLVTLIYVLFGLHVAGALKHHYLDRDGDIGRMAPGVRAGSRADPRLLLIAAGAVGAAVLGYWVLPIGGSAGSIVTPASQPRLATSVSRAPVLPQVIEVAPTPPTPSVDNTTEAVAPAAAPAATLSSWSIEPSSAIAFHTVWSGEAVSGGFSKFTGEISFSPDLLDKSHVKVTVDTGSVFSGDSQRDETLKGDDWFAVASRGSAAFEATKFKKTGADRYIANGTLQIKGVTLPIAVSFTLKIVGDSATMQGSTTVNRLAYKIGQGEYSSTTEIPAAVKINLSVKARRK